MKRNFTIGAFKAASAQYEAVKAEMIERIKLAVTARGKFFLSAVSASVAAGFFVYCVCLGFRLGLGL